MVRADILAGRRPLYSYLQAVGCPEALDPSSALRLCRAGRRIRRALRIGSRSSLSMFTQNQRYLYQGLACGVRTVRVPPFKKDHEAGRNSQDVEGGENNMMRCREIVMSSGCPGGTHLITIGRLTS